MFEWLRFLDKVLLAACKVSFFFMKGRSLQNSHIVSSWMRRHYGRLQSLRNQFLFEWLRFLDKVLLTVHKVNWSLVLFFIYIFLRGTYKPSCVIWKPPTISSMRRHYGRLLNLFFKTNWLWKLHLEEKVLLFVHKLLSLSFTL